MTQNNQSRILLLASLLAFTLSGCATHYSAAPFTGRVVDARTEEPLADVNVVAYWLLEGGLEGGTVYGALQVQEAVTDAEGGFAMPGFGPTPVPRAARSSHLTNFDPGLFLFKSGYQVRRLFNSDRSKERVRRSDWDGRTIGLEPFDGDIPAYATHLERNLDVGLESLVRKPTPCTWLSMPRMLSAIARQNRRFGAERILRYSILDMLLTNDERFAKRGCGSAKAFIEGLAL